MTLLTQALTVAQLRAILDRLPADSLVYVHASNGWGRGAARALGEVEQSYAGEVHLYGHYL